MRLGAVEDDSIDIEPLRIWKATSAERPVWPAIAVDLGNHRPIEVVIGTDLAGSFSWLARTKEEPRAQDLFLELAVCQHLYIGSVAKEPTELCR